MADAEEPSITEKRPSVEPEKARFDDRQSMPEEYRFVD
jgi:hypothetical protein